MNTPVVFLFFLVLAVVVGIAYSARATHRVSKVAEAQDSPTDPRVETLRYRVPDAQDPAVLIAALDQEGYTADLAQQDGTKVLVIGCPAGRERERARVRNVLGQSDQSDQSDMASIEGPSFTPGKITFEDENQ